MKKILKTLVSTLVISILFCGQAALAFNGKGVDNSHQKFTRQALQILQNDKGNNISGFYNEYKDVLIEYSSKPDSDENQYIFAYHFYDPYTNKNYLPKNIKASAITAKTKFTEHMKNAVDNYKTNKKFSIQELGRAIHFLEDVNVPHHAANLIGGITSHSQYEKYISGREENYFVNTSNSYDKFKNYKFERYCTLILDECAKNANSYKNLAKSYRSEDWDVCARPTIKLCQEDTASLLYRFEMEVTK
ncbi:MAG: phospholipase [Clostridium sp.]|jgi:phospholipase C|nr:phospholipase [Clostridium sp.]